MTKQSTPTTVDMSARFLKVKLSITAWGNSKQAKDCAAEMEASKGAEVGKSLKAGKILLDPTALEAIGKARNALMTQHKVITGIWDDSNWRLLPTSRYFEYSEKMNPLISQFNAAADELESRYITLVDEARSRLNGLFNDDDYPGEIEFRQRFSIKTSIENLAAGTDTSRINLPAEEVDKITASMQEAFSENLHRVQGDQWQRLLSVVTNLKDSLIAYDKGDQRTVRQTLIDSIDKTCSDIPDFNVLADPALIDAITEIKTQFATVDMSYVRENPALRTETISAASRAAAKLKAKAVDFAGYMN